MPGTRPAVDDVPRPLFGRERELSRLDVLIDNLGAGGGALVIRGGPGIGKSALLAAAVAQAGEKRLAVRRVVGVQSEAQLPFAGLHHLLLPFLGDLQGLPLPQRRALEAAFGLAEGDTPEIFMIGLATLTLFADAAEAAPVLIAVDDAHWLDQPSCEALAFAGRRLEPESVLLLLAVRDAVPSAIAEAGLPELRVAGLDDSAARALLRETAPTLPADVREQVLREAAGNPLALIELPAARGGSGDHFGIEPLPLTARLESAFAGRLADVGADARLLLLLTALDEVPIEHHVRAAESLLGQPVSASALGPAVSAGLGTIVDGRFEFRHPLIRSVIQRAVPAKERRRAHAALAQVLADDADRSVWHEAKAATGPDDGVASRLERSAERAERRGGLDIAIAAFERSAVLSADTTTRSRRLQRAGLLASETGRGQAAIRLLEEAFRLDLPANERARLAFMLEVLRASGWSGAESIRAYCRAVRDLMESGQAGMALQPLKWIALRAHWSNLDESAREELAAIAEQLSVRHDAEFLGALALIDPVGRGAEVIEQVSRWTPMAQQDPETLFAVGAAAAAVWSANLALPFLHASAEMFRSEGRLGLLAHALTFIAWDELRQGNVWAAAVAADEGARLGDDTGQPLFAASAYVAAVIAEAERGGNGSAEQRLAESEGLFITVGAHPMRALALMARGRIALASEHYGEAYVYFTRMFDSQDPAHHRFAGGWVLADLVDAAVHGDGDVERVRAIAAEWTGIADATNAPHLQVQLRYAEALLSEGADADERFEVAIGYASRDWPYYRSRTQLAYGVWLRRRRRVAESRALLREAAQTLDALGSVRLAERARRELRASGETARPRAPETWDRLTPQELQIARLAATGLSNREIGERLYLSHRTVGTHLHRLFPKLGVSSRAALGSALETSGFGATR